MGIGLAFWGTDLVSTPSPKGGFVSNSTPWRIDLFLVRFGAQDPTGWSSRNGQSPSIQHTTFWPWQRFGIFFSIFCWFFGMHKCWRPLGIKYGNYVVWNWNGTLSWIIGGIGFNLRWTCEMVYRIKLSWCGKVSHGYKGSTTGRCHCYILNLYPTGQKGFHKMIQA